MQLKREVRFHRPYALISSGNIPVRFKFEA
jgi:hypothetical protein